MSILDEIKKRTESDAGASASPLEGPAKVPNTPPADAESPSDPTPNTDTPSDAPPSKVSAAELARLLPSECSLLDLKRELSISDADCNRIKASRIKRNVYGSGEVEFFKSAGVVAFIIGSGISWERTAVSLARNSMNPEDLFSADTTYPGRSLVADLDVDERDFCDALGVTYYGPDSVPHYVAGDKLIAAIRKLDEGGKSYFFSGHIVRHALDRAVGEREAQPAKKKPDIVANAIISIRQRERDAETKRRLTLEAEYGVLVRKGEKLKQSDIERLGELSIDLGVDESHYHKCVNAIARVAHLETVDTDQHRSELNDAMSKLGDEYSELQRLENDLPKQISKKRGEINSVRDELREAKNARTEIEAIQSRFTYLFEVQRSNERSR